jgi:flagellar motor switch/type III secretory pathway protein FliN
MNDMSKAAVAWRAWLPESALGRAGIDQALADVARHWSTKWLARKSVRPLGALAATHVPPAGNSLRWVVLDNDVAVAMSNAAADRLTMLMFGETAPPTAFADADRRVLDSLLDDALRDLCRRIAEMLGLPPEARWRELGDDGLPSIDRSRGCQLGIDAATPLLHLVLATDVLVALAKRGAARSPMRERVKPIVAGLATQQVAVSASLGHCALTIADLANLGIGDVLVLDRATDAPLRLSIDGTALRRGKCSVQRDGERLELQLLEPLAS